MEEYYQKVIQLQERLRQSEEERLKLEMKFNEMFQTMKEEEEAHFKKLRSKYKQFLDEDRRRQQRNDKILEALDRIENRSQIWEAKTEKFKEFRRKYQDYLKHPNGGRSRSPMDVERPPEPKYERPKTYPEQNPDLVKNDIMEKYLQSVSSQKCKDDLLQKRTVERPPPESKYSNLGNINSILWKTPKIGEKLDLEKEYDSNQLKNNKDMENALKQNNNVPLDDGYNGEHKFMDKRYDLPSFERKPSSENKYDEKFTSGRKLSTEDQKFSSINQNPLGNDISRRTSQQFPNEPSQGRALNVHNELESLLKQHKDETQNQAPQIPSSIPKEQILPRQALPRPAIYPGNQESEKIANKPQIGNQEVPPRPQTINNQAFDRPLEGILQRQPPIPIQRRPSEAPKTELDKIEAIDRKESLELETKGLEQKTDFMEKVEPLQLDQKLEKEYDRPEQQLEGQASDIYQPLQDNTKNEPSKDFDENGQYLQQYYDESGQPLQQYKENGEPLPQYDENGQPLQQYKENGGPLPQTEADYNQTGQPLQQYDENGQPLQQFYDESGQQSQYYGETDQPLQKYDENGQPIQEYYDNNGQAQYDDNGQPIMGYDLNSQVQYDENGQPIVHYDQNGQPLSQFDENGQPLTQYDQNGQPLYDENGQPLTQYDENGQPLTQYDKNGQPLYDENGQTLTQYDENGQPLAQFDENGQPLTQYDKNGQPLYDENGQPLAQYDEHGQPLTQYDENGQPLPQYDATGQPLTQYDENGQPLQEYYDESGQPIQYYGGESAQQYDENGQPIQQQYSAQPYGDDPQYYEQPQEAVLEQPQEEKPQAETKSNVLEMLETDTESTRQDTKVSNESDFDFSNG